MSTDVHPQPRPASFLGFRAWGPKVVPIPPELSTTRQHRTVDDSVVTQYILWSSHASTTRCSVGGAAAIQPFRGPIASSEATDAGVMEGEAHTARSSDHPDPPVRESLLAPSARRPEKGTFPWTSPCTPSPSACSAMRPSAP